MLFDTDLNDDYGGILTIFKRHKTDNLIEIYDLTDITRTEPITLVASLNTVGGLLSRFRQNFLFSRFYCFIMKKERNRSTKESFRQKQIFSF